MCAVRNDCTGVEHRAGPKRDFKSCDVNTSRVTATGPTAMTVNMRDLRETVDRGTTITKL